MRSIMKLKDVEGTFLMSKEVWKSNFRLMDSCRRSVRTDDVREEEMCVIVRV